LDDLFEQQTKWTPPEETDHARKQREFSLPPFKFFSHSQVDFLQVSLDLEFS